MGELNFRVLWVIRVDPPAVAAGSGEVSGLKKVNESCSRYSSQLSALENGVRSHSKDREMETHRDQATPPGPRS